MWFLLGCAAALLDTTPYVDDARVIAVQVDPAEAEAGAPIALHALYADATGALTEAPVDWSFCTARKALAELGPVSARCLDPDDSALLPIGTGRDVTGTLPDDACSLFGPNPPPADGADEAGRPADPDVTGGFYQPAVGFSADGDATLVSARVRCGLANVTQDDYVTWNTSYLSNTNPVVDTFDVPATARPGDDVTLTVSWPDCADGACTGAETYVVYDPETQTFASRREAVSATWFTTAGTFAAARNGRDGDETERAVDNTWTAPDTAGDAWIAVVLRDERGGVGFAETRVAVAE